MIAPDRPKSTSARADVLGISELLAHIEHAINEKVFRLLEAAPEAIVPVDATAAMLLSAPSYPVDVQLSLSSMHRFLQRGPRAHLLLLDGVDGRIVLCGHLFYYLLKAATCAMRCRQASPPISS